MFRPSFTRIKRFFTLLVILMASAAECETLVAALANDDYPPFYFYDDKQRQLRGASIEICEHLIEQIGYELRFKRYPFVRLLHNLSEGNADIACTLFNTSSRAPGITFTGVPHAFEDISVFTRSDMLAATEKLDIDKLRRFRVGGVRAYYYGKSFADGDTFRKMEVNDERQLIRILLAGRIDLALGNPASIGHHAHAMGVSDRIHFIDRAIYQGPIYIGVSRAREDAHKLVARLTQAILQFRGTAQYQQILERYGLPMPQY